MGGKAFEGITRRIALEEIDLTLAWLEKKWPDYAKNGGNLKDHMLGSAGKNPTSGDIDLNLRIDSYNQDEVAKQLVAFLGEDHVKARPGNNQIFTAIPIKGSKVNGYVQIDFMFGDYDWQTFSYFSPVKADDNFRVNRYHSYGSLKQSASALKGLYRTELIKALVAYNSDWVLEEDGEMVARVGPTFFHDRGVVWRYRHRPMRKDGTARVKALSELTEDEFMVVYPSAIKAQTTETKDVDKVVKMILGDYATVDHCQTFEILWQMVQGQYTADDQKVIAKIYLERLNSLKVEIPTEVFRNYRLKV